MREQTPVGLIPAHAGKTCRLGGASRRRRAHPRSRGENLDGAAAATPFTGSSPLTRGKREGLRGAGWGRGLIPAHAGKTLPQVPSQVGVGAHPRSRGENAPGIASASWFQGSSPLTRGKPAAQAFRS